MCFHKDVFSQIHTKTYNNYFLWPFTNFDPSGEYILNELIISLVYQIIKNMSFLMFSDKQSQSQKYWAYSKTRQSNKSLKITNIFSFFKKKMTSDWFSVTLIINKPFQHGVPGIIIFKFESEFNFAAVSFINLCIRKAKEVLCIAKQCATSNQETTLGQTWVLQIKSLK